MLRVVIGCVAWLILLHPNSRADQHGDLDSIAESYVKLVLDVGLYDEGYVDFYYGPPEWRPAALDSGEVSEFPYEYLRTRAVELIQRLNSLKEKQAEDPEEARRLFLKAHIVSVAARIDMLAGKTLSFREESKALFDAVAPTLQIDDFESVLAELDSLVPGSGDLKAKLKVYRKRFVIPPDRVALVMQTALDSARSRTRAFIDLPDGDSCALEIVTGKPWRAFNAFQGNGKSIIQLNVDSPLRISGVLDCVCHEGYPGHHVNASMWEERLYRGKGWVEFSISPLYSPSSLVAEGIAECAAEMVFPGDEALQFEKDVLYPLAGLDTAEADRFRRINALADSLQWALITAAQKYLDGELSRDETVRWFTDYALMSPEIAEGTIPVVEFYRTYAITYKLGRSLIRNWITANGGSAGDSERRWQLFSELLSTPMIPSQF